MTGPRREKKCEDSKRSMGAHCHQFCSACTAKYLTKEALEWFGDFEGGGQVICIMKYADDLVLLAKEETVLQSMINTLTEIVKCYGMKINVGKIR